MHTVYLLSKGAKGSDVVASIGEVIANHPNQSGHLISLT